MTKITLATLKSFIKRESQKNNLYIKKLSDFNGMRDCVEETNPEVVQISPGIINLEDSHSLGIKSLWLVGSSRDYITSWSKGDYTGFEVSNCCGSQILAAKR